VRQAIEIPCIECGDNIEIHFKDADSYSADFSKIPDVCPSCGLEFNTREKLALAMNAEIAAIRDDEITAKLRER
jgi:hypothetical protein